MNRIDRLTAILIHLQGKPRIPLEELECRFEVSRRTIFRDIRSLIESGVPIGGDAGQGYFIVEGYHLPPLVFNRDEAGAILLGAKLIERYADQKTNAIFSEAMYKIKAVLRYRDKEYLEKLEETIAVVSSPAVPDLGFPDSHILEIQQALATQKVLRIRYFSNYNEKTSERDVEPLGLVYYASRWHLIGYCRLRQDLRDFRTDRIRHLETINENYNPQDHPAFKTFLKTMLGGTDANEAVVQFSKKAGRYVQDQKYYYGFVQEEKTDDYIEMKFVTPSYLFLARWLLMFGKEVTVIAPISLREQMANLSEELFTHHQSSATDPEIALSGIEKTK